MSIGRRITGHLLSAALPALWLSTAAAELRIEIREGVDKAVPVAVVPFGWGGQGPVPADVAAVVAADLARSGRFAPLPRDDMLAKPVDGRDVDFDDWRILGTEIVIVGRLIPQGAEEFTIQFQVFDVLRGEQILGYRQPARLKQLRAASHRVADLIYEELTGIRGVFGTQVAYVTVAGPADARNYQLVVADADGENDRVVAESKSPLMSPAWSPDSRKLAYVSFENERSEIYVQTLRSGARERVSSRAGVNGAPAWSPDGRYIYFTSDRGGAPQIYRIAAKGGDQPERVTFEGRYNARPRASPDGKQVAVVHNDRGNYRIAAVDLGRGFTQVLTDGSLDESPSFAPNGETLIYATVEAGQGVLATVSADGRIRQRISASEGDVREPAWSPFPAY